MCVDPVTAISLASAAAGAASSLMSGSANAKAAAIQAQTAEANSKMALAEGEGRVAQISQRVNNTIGAARANYAAGNLALNSGSPLAVQAMSAQQGNTDKQLTMAGALNQASGQSYAAGDALQREQQAQIAGVVGAGTAVLHGLMGVRGLGGAFGMDGSSAPTALQGAATPMGLGAQEPSYDFGYDGGRY